LRGNGRSRESACAFDRGLVTTALVGHIAVAKYGWHSTLYRQMRIFFGYGVQLEPTFPR